MMIKKLKPCPFCGGEARVRDGGDYFTVGCLDKNCICFYGTNWVYEKQENAIKAWNRRMGDD